MLNITRIIVVLALAISLQASVSAQVNRYAIDRVMALFEGTKGDMPYLVEQRLEQLEPLNKETQLEFKRRLLLLLKSPATMHRIAACAALRKIDQGHEEAVASLTEIISATTAVDSDDSQKEAFVLAIQTLGAFKGDAVPAVPALVKLLKSSNIYTRNDAANALIRMGPGAEEAIPELAKLIHDMDSVSPPFMHRSYCTGDDAAETLGAIGPTALPVLLAALNDPEDTVRYRVVKQLGKMQEVADKVVASLTQRLTDTSIGVQVEAIKSLGLLGRDAAPAVPELTKFLFEGQLLVSFPAGSGIGRNEKISWLALSSLRSIGATEPQLVPGLLQALDRSEQPTLEAIAVIAKYPHRRADFETSLRRMLEKKQVPAACALAALGAGDSAVEELLADGLIQNEQVARVALAGICYWLAHGHTLTAGSKANFEQLDNAPAVGDQKKFLNMPLNYYLAKSFLKPDHVENADEFVKELVESHPLWDSEIEAEQSEAGLRALSVHKAFMDRFMAGLQNDAELVRSRLLLPRVLIATGQRVEKAYDCLNREANNSSKRAAMGTVAGFLGNQPPSDRSTALLLKLFADETAYNVGGDFYGNDGQRRIVGDRAAMALLRLGETKSLESQLDAVQPLVRARAIKFLGQHDLHSIRAQLVAKSTDPDTQVRRLAIHLLGRLGANDAKLRNELKPTLEAALKDARVAVKDEAARMLRSWSAD